MIKIIPDFVSSETIDRLISSIDTSKATDFPHQQNIKTVNGIVYPPIHKEAKKYGNISNIEFLTYNVNSLMFPHIDKYGFDGDFKWVQTGILFMNEPSEYEGGELVFNKMKTELKCPKGTFVLFPAGADSVNYTHSVKVVTKGIRLSLVLRYKE
jgi:predicted 2-oxoglutarate/Fe(II)-dependent dioxygenase YbiX